MNRSFPPRLAAIVLGLCAAAAVANGCTSDDGATAALISTNPPTTETVEGTSVELADSSTSTEETTTTTAPAEQAGSPLPTTHRPEWLGVRTIPTNADGDALPIDTPSELLDRRIATIDTLPPPTEDNVFDPTWVTLDQAPDVLARSTWVQGCPVPPEELAYITVPFWGFDGWVHTGELIVHNDMAGDIIGVFETLYGERFPIEEMRVVTQADLDAPPIGDTNNTTAFVCRPVVGGTRFSEHAKGLALDINPFHNPYVNGELVLPEQATVYTDRTLNQPGMLGPDSIVVQAFTEIGWIWGGNWNSLKDYQHFSANGR